MKHTEKGNNSLDRMLSRLKDPKVVTYLKGDTVYGHMMTAIAAEFDDIVAAIDASRAAPVAVDHGPSSPTAPLGRSEPAPTPIMADSEAAELQAVLAKRFGFEGMGNGRLVADVLVVISKMSEELQKLDGHIGAISNRLLGVFPGTVEEGEALDPDNMRSVLGALLKTRDQIIIAEKSVRGTVQQASQR